MTHTPSSHDEHKQDKCGCGAPISDTDNSPQKNTIPTSPTSPGTKKTDHRNGR